ncbi:hypothetical protein L1987_79579 [Smallanthus sonchifolius]|uniref:Uncharacterized protein n=1 Tax=Smallanthus sonchifolius TaxID=185202 RepID=A0ACB8YKA0_9ASTR|nr:hypothetical protein L1987_79579 [Smallanthus sonchifolius]
MVVLKKWNADKIAGQALDGKGLGADITAFLSSDEGRYGEVGTNVVVWGGRYMGWARYSGNMLAKVLCREDLPHYGPNDDFVLIQLGGDILVLPLSKRVSTVLPPEAVPKAQVVSGVVPECSSSLKTMDVEMSTPISSPKSSPVVPGVRVARWLLLLTNGNRRFVRSVKCLGTPFLMCKKRPISVEESTSAPKAVNISAPAIQPVSGTSTTHVKVAKPPIPVPDEDGFTIVNRKGKNKSIKLQRKKKQVVVMASPNGLKSNPRSTTKSGPSCSKDVGSGFDFARAVQGVKVNPVRPPIQHPRTKSQSAGPVSRPAVSHPPAHSSSMEVDHNAETSMNFTELDIPASIKRTCLVEAQSDLYPNDPINEVSISTATSHSGVKDHAADRGDPAAVKQVCQINREHIEGARLLPASILSSPSPGGIHTNNGGKSYGISESQRKAIADRLSVSSSICGEETVNWSPGEWDYFNDLCISLGLDPDYCIEDVDSDTENGTAQFMADLWKSGCPKSTRRLQVRLLDVSLGRSCLWSDFKPILKAQCLGSVCMFGDQNYSGLGNDTTPTNITYLSNLVGMEFARETALLVDSRSTGSNISGNGSIPTEIEREVSDLNQSSGGLKSGRSIDVPPQAGTIAFTDSEMVGPEIAPESTLYGMYSPRKEGSDIQSIIWDGPNGHYSLTARSPERDSGNTVSGLSIGTQHAHVIKDVTNQVNAQSQNGIQNSGGRKSKGFDFSRAVNGAAGVSNPVQSVHLHPTQSGTSTGADPIDVDQPAPKPNQQSKPMTPSHPVDTHNRFLVLDFEKSIKYNKLVGDGLDSGMADQFGSGVVDPVKSNEPPQEQLVCQVNRDYKEGVRILPSSVVSPPKVTQQPTSQNLTSETPVIEERETKDYGISNAQKMAITSRLCGPAQAVRAVDMDNWDQGEHLFFEDQVKAMGLDYDYCIEDVDSDDENGTAQFFAAQMKVGMPKVPIPTTTQLS